MLSRFMFSRSSSNSVSRSSSLLVLSGSAAVGSLVVTEAATGVGEAGFAGGSATSLATGGEYFSLTLGLVVTSGWGDGGV